MAKNTKPTAPRENYALWAAGIAFARSTGLARNPWDWPTVFTANGRNMLRNVPLKRL